MGRFYARSSPKAGSFLPQHPSLNTRQGCGCGACTAAQWFRPIAWPWAPCKRVTPQVFKVRCSLGALLSRRAALLGGFPRTKAGSRGVKRTTVMLRIRGKFLWVAVWSCACARSNTAPVPTLVFVVFGTNITETPVAGFLAPPHPSKLRTSLANAVVACLCALVGALVAGRSWGSVLRRLRTTCTNVAVLSAETDLPIVLGLPRGRAGAQNMPLAVGKAPVPVARPPRPRPDTPRDAAPF